MIESVFLFLAAIAFIMFILHIETESVIYGMTSIMLWLLTMVNTLWIEVPGIDTYTEYTINALGLIFIFVNILALLYRFMQLKKENEVLL